jgi:hypothetical protein
MTTAVLAGYTWLVSPRKVYFIVKHINGPNNRHTIHSRYRHWTAAMVTVTESMNALNVSTEESNEVEKCGLGQTTC